MRELCCLTDTYRIPQLASEGKTVEEISRILDVAPEAVENFMPKTDAPLEITPVDEKPSKSSKPKAVDAPVDFTG